MDRPRIIVANAGKDVAERLRALVAPSGMEVLGAGAEDDVASLLQEGPFKLVIACSNGGDAQDSLGLIRQIRRSSKTVPVIFITGQSSEQLAIAALRAGADDYFTLSFSDDSLQSSLRRLLMASEAPSTSAASSRVVKAMVGESRGMQEVRDYIKRVAATDSTVLITGETGTGKELAAEMIHLYSRRKKNPFIRINCSALPDSLVESEMFGYERGAFTGATAGQKGKLIAANGGGVLFDEIGDMNTFAQAKILRSIELKEVYPLGSHHPVKLDFRIIAATNRNPEKMVADGRFREDLYYRLNVARVHLPPLRQRKQDIPELAAFAIENLNRRLGQQVQGLTEETLACLMRYDWPGNVRELMNLLEATYINLPRRRIAVDDLPKTFLLKLRAADGNAPDERNVIFSTLVNTKWNKATAARKLNWSRMTLYRKIAKYSIVEKRHPPR
ncbi:MAG: sigma-54 dependent transcriptional regulator [Deltaproteobacteria bacterium]|nr:sigma-54 dependent transcriptional regulator [Deltaproteobacteria bacterium]